MEQNNKLRMNTAATQPNADDDALGVGIGEKRRT